MEQEHFGEGGLICATYQPFASPPVGGGVCALNDICSGDFALPCIDRYIHRNIAVRQSPTSHTHPLEVSITVSSAQASISSINYLEQAG